MRTCYRDLGIPILWLLGYCLHQFVNSPLHQVFMGVGKDLIKLMEMYLAHFSKRASFLWDIENIMLDIRGMQLKFCHLDTFSSTNSTPLTSGWLCDNFVAFTLIMPALFFNIFQAQISQNLPILIQIITGFDSVWFCCDVPAHVSWTGFDRSLTGACENLSFVL